MLVLSMKDFMVNLLSCANGPSARLDRMPEWSQSSIGLGCRGYCRFFYGLHSVFRLIGADVFSRSARPLRRRLGSACLRLNGSLGR